MIPDTCATKVHMEVNVTVGSAPGNKYILEMSNVVTYWLYCALMQFSLLKLEQFLERMIYRVPAEVSF